MIQIPDFTTKKELFDWLRLNKKIAIQAKKSAIKHGDPVVFHDFKVKDGNVVKSEPNEAVLSLTDFPVKVVINTTNIRDHHKDVHIPGLWKKSISENKLIYHLQEHEMKFDHIISDMVTASTQQMKWTDLGYDYKGTTEALIFDSRIETGRNAYMAEQYAKGYVKNHSVGMQYVQIVLAMNSESKFDVEEKAVWDKYIDQIVNRAEVEEDGYFWAVTEAKLIEGSAVPLGSNCVTPTISVGEQPKSLESADTVTDSQPNRWAKVAEAISKTKN